jgi:hypothetical protein
MFCSAPILSLPMLYQIFDEICINSIQGENLTAHTKTVKHHDRTLLSAFVSSQENLELKKM